MTEKEQIDRIIELLMRLRFGSITIKKEDGKIVMVKREETIKL